MTRREWCDGSDLVVPPADTFTEDRTRVVRCEACGQTVHTYSCSGRVHAQEHTRDGQDHD